jgi:general secretion pathway protein D
VVARQISWLLVCLTVLSFGIHAQPVSFNLKNADIRSVIDMVSDVTGKNFIIDPRVKGKVTLVSSTPIEPEGVYEIFLSIMKVHGYVAVQEGDVVNILPANEGVQGASVSSSVNAEGEMQVRVIPVINVKAVQLVPSLRPLVSKTGHLAAHDGSNTLVVSDTGRRIKRLIEIVKRLDVKDDGSLEAIRLKFAAASQVTKILQPLLAQNNKNASGTVKLAADDRSNTILMIGNKYLRQKLRELVNQMDVKVEHKGETRVIYLKFAKASDLAEVLRNTMSDKYTETNGKQTGSTDSERKLGIQADEDTNALLITARSDQHAEIQSVIDSLDVRRAQVLVESLVVELTDDKARDLGVQWVAAQNDLINLSDAATFASNTLQLGNVVGRLNVGQGVDIGILARALANDADANIISTPSLITMDNAEAEINVGREVPFVTGSYTGASNSSTPENPFTTIERSNVGLIMKLTPQINFGSAIRLDIDQQISSLLPGAAAQFGTTDVVTSVRSIKTSVVVEDGNILVLGGLIDDTLRESRVKVPLLGDIPIIGELFNYREASKEKRNLMIFIRPKILRDEESSRLLSEQKYQELREQQLQQYQQGLKLLPDTDVPVLEPIPEKPPQAKPSTNSPAKPPAAPSISPTQPPAPTPQKVVKQPSPHPFDDY